MMVGLIQYKTFKRMNWSMTNSSKIEFTNQGRVCHKLSSSKKMYIVERADRNARFIQNEVTMYMYINRCTITIMLGGISNSWIDIFELQLFAENLIPPGEWAMQLSQAHQPNIYHLIVCRVLRPSFWCRFRRILMAFYLFRMKMQFEGKSMSELYDW
jgi:hypothetical protein